MAFIQGNVAPQNTTSGTTLAFPSNVTAGNTIIIAIVHNYPGCPPSVSDSQGNTYTQVITTLVAAQPYTGYLSVWYAPITTSGPNIVTETFSCSQAPCFFITEYSGIAATPFDTSNKATNPSNPCSSGAITTATANELVISIFKRGSGLSATYTAISGTIQLNVAGGIGSWQDQVQVTAGSVNPSVTASSVIPVYPVAGWTFAFKQASAPSTANSNFLMFM